MKTLIQCPACAREISPSAVSCPHCGEVIKKEQSATGLFAAIAIGLLIGLVIYLAVSHAV